MKEFWNERYAMPDYVYGKSPNQFFAEQLQSLGKVGRLLLPMEGEGRNAVYAASLGWKVTAMDFATEGRAKALQLAQEVGEEIDYALGNIREFDFPLAYYDAVGLVYAHLPANTRQLVHGRLQNALKVGGVLILEAFSKRQLGKSSGGPKDLSMLYSAEDLKIDFTGLEILLLEELDVQLQEGEYHSGDASVVRMVAHKIS